MKKDATNRQIKPNSSGHQQIFVSICLRDEDNSIDKDFNF